MMVRVKVIANSRKARIERNGDVLSVHVAAPATKGKANAELVDAVADYFSVRRRDVRIVSGLTSRNKTVEIHQRGM